MTVSHLGHSVLPTWIAIGPPERAAVADAAEEGRPRRARTSSGRRGRSRDGGAPARRAIVLAGDLARRPAGLRGRDEGGAVGLTRGQPTQHGRSLSRPAARPGTVTRSRDRAAAAGPPSTPANAPATRNGPYGAARRSTSRSRRTSASTSPGTANSTNPAYSPTSRARPSPASPARAEQRGQPHVAVAHPGRVHPPQHPEERPNTATSAEQRAAAGRRRPAATARPGDHDQQPRTTYSGQHDQARQQPGAPVDAPPAPRTPATSGTRPSSGGSASRPQAPTQPAGRRRHRRGADAEAGRRRDLGVGLLRRHAPAGSAPPGRRLAGAGIRAIRAETSGRRAGQQRRRARPTRTARARGAPLAAASACSRAARHLRQRSTGTPVISSTWSTAWCTSRSSPATSGTPGVTGGRARAASATGRRRRRTPRRRADAACSAGRRSGRRRAPSRPAGRPLATSTAQRADHAPPRPRGDDGSPRRSRPRAPGRGPAASTSRAPSRHSASASRRRRRARPEDRGADAAGRRSARAAPLTAPGTSVLSASAAAVDRAPACSRRRASRRPVGDLVGQVAATSRLSGIGQRQPAPAVVELGEERRRARRPARRPRRRSSRRPSAAYAARCIAGDSECAIGEPSTAQRIGSASARVGASCSTPGSSALRSGTCRSPR